MLFTLLIEACIIALDRVTIKIPKLRPTILLISSLADSLTQFIWIWILGRYAPGTLATLEGYSLEAYP